MTSKPQHKGVYVTILTGKHKGRCGVIDSVATENGRGHYQVTDPAVKETLGWFGVRQIMPITREYPEHVTAAVSKWNPHIQGRIEALLAERERLVKANAAPYRIQDIDSQVAAWGLRRDRVGA